VASDRSFGYSVLNDFFKEIVMKLQEQQKKFAENVSALIDYIFSKQYTCTLGEAFRTPEQAALYAKEGKGIINSLHCKRLAIDLNIFSPGGDFLENTEDYEHFGLFWEGLDPVNRWGGRFKRADGNHFERQEF
jgi:hypothetical protein